ncbi:hypothetical protein F7U78_00640 [Vibrio parahaemolyticus]|nr:hypothetical protein [Vibrio parahaemolyticus]EGQ9190026.1 hypothetical protein [Vibrio parahaemolyticus]EGQ9219982.1 hypothetical protein [Vibrio parahaemolyticus]EGR1500596.1 hypothetical protein [Vibrio parahaemolyticus]EGR3261370.1 hypothetical protein [Vibrio parahaemolyticus]
MDFKTLASSGAVFVNQVMRLERNISIPSGFSVI